MFRVYKGFDTPHIDTLELMVEQLYKKWNITDRTDFAGMQPTDYPILSNLYDTIQDAYDNYDAAGLYPREMLRDLLLGLHSMCRGADARFFNGHTNIDRSKFLVFCVKGLDNMAENLRNTLLFSLLSYMSDQLLTLGNSVAAIDELYLWLSDPTVITYIRNALKRVRKKGIRPVPCQPESGGLHPAGNTGADAPSLFHPRPSVHLQRRQRGQEILHG